LNRLLGILVVARILSGQEVNPDKRLQLAQVAMRVFLSPESVIPPGLIGRAQCLVVVPQLRGFGGGRGFASCRGAGGGWSAPAAVVVEGRYLNRQLDQGGYSAAGLIMLVMNSAGMEYLLRDSFTLGGEIAVVEGPIGKSESLNTDLLMNAAMISYSRATQWRVISETRVKRVSRVRTSSVGLSLKGATLRADVGENKKLYGREIGNREILMGKVDLQRAPAARRFAELLGIDAMSLLNKMAGGK
jgi:lipid-binding SYLF domain-containing protein